MVFTQKKILISHQIRWVTAGKRKHSKEKEI